ncbi:uncharacterized protein LTR77_007423 [Saxophila tyrrhenica]|uniref:Uncharacterized protein n=1 Tax=Saxophila tyrrhenica TaxID=1690608 RepID=A0AAV9P805_9PEZI|nr:hypothetical protein LTR77_007423 [Saxophila tyrrhenica]
MESRGVRVQKAALQRVLDEVLLDQTSFHDSATQRGLSNGTSTTPTIRDRSSNERIRGHHRSRKANVVVPNPGSRSSRRPNNSLAAFNDDGGGEQAPGPVGLLDDAGQLAVNVFLHACVTDAHWTFMTDLLGRQDAGGPAVMHAMKACGMTVLIGSRPPSSVQTTAEQVDYTHAVRSLQPLLENSVHVRDDSTLLAVFLLGLYEPISTDRTTNASKPSQYKAHIRGATELLRLRGPDTFTSTAAAALFLDWRPQILFVCLWDCDPVPEFLLDWPKWLETDKIDPNVRRVEELYGVLARILNLRAEIAAPQPSMNKETLMREMITLTNALDRWEASARTSGSWRYHAVPKAETQCSIEYVWSIKTYAYTQPYTVSGWNMYRMIRILLHLMFRAIYIEKSAESAGQQNLEVFTAARKLMVDDICASFAAVIGEGVELTPHPRSKFVRAYQAVWSLFFAGISLLVALQDGSSGAERCYQEIQLSWIMSKLRLLWRVHGIKWAAGPLVALTQSDRVPVEYQQFLDNMIKLPRRAAEPHRKSTPPTRQGGPDSSSSRLSSSQITTALISCW